MRSIRRPVKPREPAAATQRRAARRPGWRPLGRPLVLLVCLAAPAVAYASGQRHQQGGKITADELLVGAAFGVAEASPALAEEHILALSAEMREFVNNNVDRNGTEHLKLQQLAAAIVDEEAFGLVYDDRTRTAAETFQARRGNCLSFSTMFVAMARDVGLNVQFQEVEIPPDWTLDNDTYVLNQHVNVFVDLGLAGTRVVDFNIADFRASYPMRRIRDSRALAHYHNNIGVERMQADDTASAFLHFRSAIAENDREFSPSWVNLGTLYLRHGHPAHAEAAYLEALRADESDLVAMSSLARLYERLGNRELAAAYRKRVIRHRNRNPYYRYELARRAYSAQHWDAAIDHLSYAARRRPQEDQFCFLLGMSYLKKGNERAAQRWLDRAKEVAASDEVKRRYASKIENLVGHKP